MKKKSTLILLIAVIILGGIAIYISKEKSVKSTIRTDDADFAVRDTENITALFLADKKGNEVYLERRGPGEWTLNEKYEARQSGIDVLLQTISNLKVYGPVSRSKYETVLKKIASSGIKVEIYKSDKEDPYKTFYVGSSNMDHTGNYMLLEGAQRPYVMHIEGFHGYLTPRFIVRENDWRTKNIWKYKFGEIEEIIVDYPKDPSRGFKISRTAPGKFDLYDVTGKKVIPYDTAEVLGYIAMYKEVNFESYEEKRGKSYQDSILRQTPEAIYQVTDKEGVKRKVTTYKKPMRDKVDPETGEEIEYDLDRMYATIDDSVFVVVQYYVFDPLTANIDEFKLRESL